MYDDLARSQRPKALSSAVSITLHVALGTAVLLGTTSAVRPNPVRPDSTIWVVAPEAPANRGDAVDGLPLPGPIHVVPPDLNAIPGSTTIPDGAVLSPVFSPVFALTARSGDGPPNNWDGVVTEERAEVLSGPLPVYPDLLRQAGVQGRVVLEATVDTTGRVLAPSILVVSATNSGFVAPARQALLATLFRSAMVGGKSVRMRVRLPYEFALRNGMGHAR